MRLDTVDQVRRRVAEVAAELRAGRMSEERARAMATILRLALDCLRSQFMDDWEARLAALEAAHQAAVREPNGKT